MWMIPGHIYDIHKGRQRIKELQEELKSEFDAAVHDANVLKIALEMEGVDTEYSARKAEDENAQRAWQEKVSKSQRGMIYTGSAIITAILAWPMLIQGRNVIDALRPDLTAPQAFLSLLIFSGICALPLVALSCTIIFIVSFMSYQKARKQKPKQEQIYKFDFDKDPKPVCFHNLTMKWIDGITFVPLVEENEEDYGMIGEYLLLQSLLDYSLTVKIETLPGAIYLALHRTMIDDGLDADVVLISISGIWLLESKYLKGSLVLNNRTWYRRKEEYVHGKRAIENGSPSYIDEVLDNPEEQWIREKEAIMKILKKWGADNQKDLDGLVKGGIVFTHPKSSVSGDKVSEVSLGYVETWINAIRDYELNLGEVPTSKRLSIKEMLAAADLILAHSRSLNEETVKSAVDIANETYENTKFETIMFIDHIKKEFGITTNKELAELAEPFKEDLDPLLEEWGVKTIAQ